MTRIERDTKAEIQKQIPKEAGREFRRIANREFNIIKDQMIEEFESHPITQEIEAGAYADNSSGTLGGYGNLSSFIGFPDDFDPISPIRERLHETKISELGFFKGKLNLMTTEPTRQELFDMTKISAFRSDFEGGRSWLDGIETGLSGLGLYLYDLKKDFGEKSRSGPAIQLGGGKESEKAFGSGSTGGAIGVQRSRYTRTSYISSILKNFIRSVKLLERRVVK